MRAPTPSRYSLPPGEPTMSDRSKVQVQFALPYSREAKDDERVRDYLRSGWRITQLQRLSDQEVLITFQRDGVPAGA